MERQKTRVKNKAPAEIQITAEQLLREAHDRGSGGGKRGGHARSQITDPDELREYRMIKRKEFEDAIRMNRVHLGNYYKYAKWEEEQEEFERARSVYERALDIDSRSQSLWLKYAEMEMRNKFVNHARNVWDRAVTLLPRVDQFWYKYTYMEEMLENFAIARTVWERWMKWEPDDTAWSSYVKFEERRGDSKKVRELFERFIACHPTVPSYLKYARWEEKRGQIPLARTAYERCLAELADWEMDQDEKKAYLAFGNFEERQREYERARAIYKYASEKFPEWEKAKRALVDFEKKHGDAAAIEAQLMEKRAKEYEEKLSLDVNDYDTWLDLARLYEEHKSAENARETYERAVANVPPIKEKKYWRRYVYLWLNYAVYEELVEKDYDRTKAIYEAALDVVPHRSFTFGKLWLQAAEFHVRRKDLDSARKILGTAIGKCPGKPKLFKGYQSLERRLGELERCRKICAKFVETAPYNSKAWIGFAELEAQVGEVDRARAIFDLAVERRDLDLPELVWKAYIDLEIDEDSNRASLLYERLLERTKHVKVWTSYAKYLASREKISVKERAREARAVMERGYDHLKHDGENKEERVALLDEWVRLEASFNEEFDNVDQLNKVRSMMPRKVKKRRRAGEDGEYEDEYYYELVFPDDEKAPLNLKILEMARKWKMSTTSS